MTIHDVFFVFVLLIWVLIFIWMIGLIKLMRELDRDERGEEAGIGRGLDEAVGERERATRPGTTPCDR